MRNTKGRIPKDYRILKKCYSTTTGLLKELLRTINCCIPNHSKKYKGMLHHCKCKSQAPNLFRVDELVPLMSPKTTKGVLN
eukprot:408797-Amphidinium_carterae.1